MNGLTSIFLLLSLTSCATTIKPTDKIPYLTESQLQDVKTNADLLEYAKQAQTALEQCNRDK